MSIHSSTPLPRRSPIPAREDDSLVHPEPNDRSHSLTSSPFQSRSSNDDPRSGSSTAGGRCPPRSGALDHVCRPPSPPGDGTAIRHAPRPSTEAALRSSCSLEGMRWDVVIVWSERGEPWRICRARPFSSSPFPLPPFPPPFSLSLSFRLRHLPPFIHRPGEMLGPTASKCWSENQTCRFASSGPAGLPYRPMVGASMDQWIIVPRCPFLSLDIVIDAF